MQSKGKALEAFQTDPPTTIFLLNANVATVGLTLTAANNIILVRVGKVGGSGRLGDPPRARVGGASTLRLRQCPFSQTMPPLTPLPFLTRNRP